MLKAWQETVIIIMNPQTPTFTVFLRFQDEVPDTFNMEGKSPSSWNWVRNDVEQAAAVALASAQTSGWGWSHSCCLTLPYTLLPWYLLPLLPTVSGPHPIFPPFPLPPVSAPPPLPSPALPILWCWQALFLLHPGAHGACWHWSKGKEKEGHGGAGAVQGCSNREAAWGAGMGRRCKAAGNQVQGVL